jgi:hypothetical protein
MTEFVRFERGYYLLPRGWMESDIFFGKPFCRRAAWVWLIERASFDDGEFLRRGEFLASYRVLAKEWGWSKDCVARFILALRRRDKIRLATRGNAQSVISICYYDEMQSPRRAAGRGDEDQLQQLTRLHRDNAATPCNEFNKNESKKQLSREEQQRVEALFLILDGIIRDPASHPALGDLTEPLRWMRQYDWEKFVIPTISEWAKKNRMKLNPKPITSFRYLTQVLASKSTPKRKKSYFD